MVLIKKLLSISSIHWCRGFFHMCSSSCAGSLSLSRSLSINVFFLSIRFFNVHCVLPVDWRFSQELFLPGNTSIILIESALNWCSNMHAYKVLCGIKRIHVKLSTRLEFHWVASTVPWSDGDGNGDDDDDDGIHICIVYLKIYKCIQIYMRFVLLYGLLTVVNDLDCINTCVRACVFVCTRVNLASKDE